MGWHPKPSPEIVDHIISQCESTIDCVIGGYNEMELLNSVGAWFRYLNVTIRTAALGPNVNTASSNYWGEISPLGYGWVVPVSFR